MKQKVTLNESQIKRIVLESVKRILKEVADREIEEMFPLGGKVVFNSKSRMASTGGKLKNIIKKGTDELIFAWSDDRGMVVSNDSKTLQMLKTGRPKSPKAALVALQNDRVVDVIDWDGYGIYSQHPITNMTRN